MEKLTDEQLMLQVKGGDAASFDLLIQRFQKPLYHFISRFLGDPVAAEDIFQDTFLRIYRAAPTYEPQAKFSTYAYRIATNLCINELKKRRRRYNIPIREETDLDDDSEIGSPGYVLESKELPADTDLERRELIVRVRKSLAKLPEPQRMALILSYYHGLPYEEIATISDCSVGTVKSRVFRAKQTLLDDLEGADEL